MWVHDHLLIHCSDLDGTYSYTVIAAQARPPSLSPLHMKTTRHLETQRTLHVGPRPPSHPLFRSGRHIFIYGDRGAGKTSLALTAAYEHNPSSGNPAYVACGSTTTFSSIVQIWTAHIHIR